MATTQPESIDWRQQFDITRAKIARLRRTARLQANPRFETAVRESARTIRIRRPTSNVASARSTSSSTTTGTSTAPR